MKQTFSVNALGGLLEAVSQHAKAGTLQSASLQIEPIGEEHKAFSVEYGVAVSVEGNCSMLVIQTASQLEAIYDSQQ
jgi:hypothetical protein